jgi:hypothetical protein
MGHIIEQISYLTDQFITNHVLFQAVFVLTFRGGGGEKGCGSFCDGETIDPQMAGRNVAKSAARAAIGDQEPVFGRAFAQPERVAHGVGGSSLHCSR